MGREHKTLQLLADYWDKRSGHYDSPLPDVFGRNITSTFLRKLNPKSLVEVGCGTGQLFAIYKNIPYVVGCDWTDGMLTQSKKRIERHNYSNIKLKKLDITKEALKQKFDVALTRTVLMHIPEEDVSDACGNLCKMADTVMLFEFYDPNAPGLEWHCFHHEYPLIMRKYGFEISEAYDRPDGLKQMLMIFRKEKKMNG